MPFFVFAPEVRKIIYATNAMESRNASVRKAVRKQGPFSQRSGGHQTHLAGTAQPRTGRIHRSHGTLLKRSWQASSATDTC